jgi:CheY-like chemotaxis protein
MADVLIVDDSATIRDLLTAILEAEGHRVREARDGREALDLLAQRIPDLALLDVEMPILTGPEMAYEMFVRDCGLEEIPIILLSGIVGLPELAAAVGTPYFLAKPYSVEALLRVVNQALRERAAPHPNLEAR